MYSCIAILPCVRINDDDDDDDVTNVTLHSIETQKWLY